MRSVLVRRSMALVVAVTLAASLSACGRRRVVQQQQPPQQQTQVISAGGSYGGNASVQPMGGGAGVVLGSDLFCQFGNVRLQLTGNGQLVVDGEFVGTISQDGGFYNVDGVEIGRLYENGRMQYAGTMQDAGIDGSQIVSPAGTIAFIDGNGYMTVTGSSVAPAAVIGISQPTVRTFLFAFSMFAALLDTAQRMGY
jgi:hypothetical protein